MKILTFSSLYPNRAQPHHGVFVENRLRHLVAEGSVEARVIAPVPWFPFTAERFGAYAGFVKAPREDTRFGLEILYPRYPVIPKIGMSATPFLMYRMVRAVVERVRRDGFDFDLIDAHYFYPDGVAAVMLARHFQKEPNMARSTIDKEVRRALVDAKGMIQAAEKADCNEAETRRRIERIFESVMGYDPFKHLSRERAVRGAGEAEYVDFSIEIGDGDDKKPIVMVEIKRVNVDLAQKHLKRGSFR